MSDKFAALGLSPILLQTLNEIGYQEPTPIQSEAIPHLLAGRDVMGQAQTGTGKTAAFSLPTIQQLDDNSLQVLILTPTRELAIQDAEAMYRYGKQVGLRVLPIYGGQSYDRQVRRLKKGVQAVVGTPGRTLDLIRQGVLDLQTVRFLILDEGDEMLKMGFIDDIEQIIAATDASKRQTILFSATVGKQIRAIAEKYMRQPIYIQIESEQLTADNVRQRHYVINESDKIAALSRVLEVEQPQSVLIFARTKVGAAKLAEQVVEQGFAGAAIHGDLSQQERERILGRFRQERFNVLVATDVMARGVDIPAVSHVVNFDIPPLAIEYVHRIGRTGRAGRAGEAITLITPRQRRSLKVIENYVGHPIPRGKLPSREQVLQIRHQQFRDRLIEQIEKSAEKEQDHVLQELADMGFMHDQVANALIGILREQEAVESLSEISDIRGHQQARHERRNGRHTRDASNGRGNGRRRDKREAGMVRLILPMGKATGIRPADVVYKIASSAHIPGHVIGYIEIQQERTYVDVPAEHVDTVLRKGKRVTIRGRTAHLKLA